MGPEQRKYILFGVVLLLPILSYYGKSEDFQIDPEYLNGILAASSILLGFLGVMLGRIPKEYFEKFAYKYYLPDLIYGSIESLSFSVIYIVLNAMRIIPSSLPPALLTVSFLYNAALIVLYLHYHFKRIKLGKCPQPF